MSKVIQKIVLSQLFLASEEDTALWDLPYDINTIFPENRKDKNLEITQQTVIWMYETGKITFFSDNKNKEKLFFTDKYFLYNAQNWEPTPFLDDALWVMITDQGNAYYDEFRVKFVESIISDGLIRKGKRYYLSSRIKQLFRNIKSHFFISDVVRTLGIPPIHITPYLIQYFDSFTRTQCIVDTRTNLITDISRIEN